jgi:DNA mismatch repair ATPase MutS
MAGAEALGALSGRGIAQAAGAVGESAEHIVGYFAQLRAELGFLLGCLNLHDALAAKGEPTCLPEPVPAGTPALSARGLYDACLSLALGPARAIGSDVEADGKRLVVITGANRGGKSTFLRSLGLAQLLLQAGMFVPAESFRADVRDGLFTHFKREEDAGLRSGKLDEELGRMSAIVDQARPGSLVLLNESFASTNEREGSEIGRQIVRALLEAGIKVGYVTHMYDLASSLDAERDGKAAFLRAERLVDGRRTFRIVPGEPLPTSHGQDIYRRIFGDGADGAGSAAAAGVAVTEPDREGAG